MQRKLLTRSSKFFLHMRRVLHHTLHELGLNVILMFWEKMFNFILVLELFYVVTTTTYDLFRHFLIFMGTYINISSCCNFFKHLVWDTNRKTHFYSLFT